MRFPPTGHKPFPNPADRGLTERNGSRCGCGSQSTILPFPLGGNPSSSPPSPPALPALPEQLGLT